MDMLILKPLLAALLIGVLSGIVGVIILWKNYSYFGDGLAHACLLGVVLANVLNIDTLPALIIISILFSLSLVFFNSRQHSKNSIIGITAFGFLSLAIIVASVAYQDSSILTKFLFGDILYITYKDLIALFIILSLTIIVFCVYYKDIILSAINLEIACSLKAHTNFIEFLLPLVISIVIAVSMKVLGALLVNAMLLIPAFIARIFSRSPISMLIYSAIIACLISISGLSLSLFFDLPTTPLIVFIGFSVLIILRIFKAASPS